MMFNWYTSHAVESERRNYEAEKAEKYRLIKAISANPSLFVKTYHQLIVRFGTILMDWGYRLKSRYETLAVSRGTGSISERRSAT
jgi:hypothetical protein